MEELQGYLDGLAVKMGGYVAGIPMRILQRITGLGLQVSWLLSRQGTARKTDTLLTSKRILVFGSCVFYKKLRLKRTVSLCLLLLKGKVVILKYWRKIAS